jgi:hypothetical protein
MRMRVACHVTEATDTLRICINYCVPRKEMFTLTRLIDTLYAHYIAVILKLIQRMAFRTFIVVYSANHFKNQALTPREILITTILHKVV